jgi:hypothetical protein
MIGNVSDSMKSAFEAKYNLILSSRLGFGFDGEIFLTNSNTAVKFFKEREKYSRERRAYEIIMQCGVTRVLGHEVPQLRRADDGLMAIEMNLVRPPHSSSTSPPLIPNPKSPISPKKYGPNGRIES